MNPEQVLEIWSTCSDDPVFFADLIEAALLEGKVLVPVEPTEEMIEACCKNKLRRLNERQTSGGFVGAVVEDYKAMLQAAKGGE